LRKPEFAQVSVSFQKKTGPELAPGCTSSGLAPHHDSGTPPEVTVAQRDADEEALLVRECLAGSPLGWERLYCRYISLVRTVVRRHLAAFRDETDDIVQSVFAVLVTSLKTYDATYPLPRFIAIIAERTCIQEYRGRATAKRSADTDPIDTTDSGEEGAKRLASGDSSSHEMLEQAEMVDIIRRAFRTMGERCRELLRLRYYDDVPYKEMTKTLGATENTLTVQAKRCLQELRAKFDETARSRERKTEFRDV
jgi:RNA polymerase sigma factor (sigma-70 family)